MVKHSAPQWEISLGNQCASLLEELKCKTIQLRQNYSHDSEAAVNRIINLKMYSSYNYLSMFYYFDRDDVALHHVAEFFKEQSHEEKELAEKFIKYQNKRGGRVVLQDIKKPERDEWGNPLDAMQAALALEKTVNQAVLELHNVATDRKDPHLCDFLESEHLREHVEHIKKIGHHITNLRRLGLPNNGMGEYLFDKHSMEESS
ncbi:ferritin, middle subunit-like isoform X1 [Bufo bufo]|uniref:ferritin, middle subunit-like isoform X1 n=1 Tax=Bufo bufo TaxID=8384 RepID=UPI001ABECA86|nr:ferritin, middle subunit-like isoform X1 [Bufo bufo]XP_040289172.1 ferritin, middle subunit-like isoform X1 [Bufo bufo]